MCGIGGYKGELFATYKEKVLASLAEGLKSRGEHATGIGYYNGEHPKVLKAPVKPTKVDWETLFAFSPCKSDTVIFHNRFATHGKPEVNKNNHPFNGNSYLLAHNGVLTNYKELLTEYNLTVSAREPETDSYSLVKIIDKIMADGKSLVDALKELCPKVNGSMVLTILTNSNELVLVRGSKYNYKLYQINEKNYIYASAANTKGSKEHIDIALEPLWLDLIKSSDPGNFTVKDIIIPEYSITVIDAEGNIKQELFEKPKSVSAPSYTSYSTGNSTYNYSPKNGSYYGSYSAGYPGYGKYYQPSLFQEKSLEETSEGQVYINDVMDELEDVWDRYYLTKFDYESIRDYVECEVSAFSTIAELKDAFGSARKFALALLESNVFADYAEEDSNE